MSLTSRLIIPKNILQNVKNRRNPTHSLINKKSTILSTNFKTKEDELNTSWDFTPFPDLFFPSQKSQILKDINGLNFDKSLFSQNTDKKNAESKLLFTEEKSQRNISTNKYNNIQKHFLSKKSNSLLNIFKENRGDITKHSPPAYSFGSSRDDCKFPFLQNNCVISPSPSSYNLIPLEGLGGSSIKYSINKKKIFKSPNKFIEPGPGYYNTDKCDMKNNGNIIMSSFENSRISNFWKYSERKDDNKFHSDWFMKPAPGSYNIVNKITMFNGSGKFPISNFRSNISKSIDKYRGLSRGRLKVIYPGPGYYNHYSIFKEIN